MDTIKAARKKAGQLKLLFLDVDGVLTDGRLYFDDHGREYKSFHVQDGHGIKMLRQNGIEVAVISGRKSAPVSLRMQSLGIEYVFQGQEDKLSAFFQVLDALQIEPRQAAHIGDDLPDLPLMKRVGLAIAVADANAVVRDHADWCTGLKGGQGAVREVCDFILEAQGKMAPIIQSYLK